VGRKDAGCSTCPLNNSSNMMSENKLHVIDLHKRYGGHEVLKGGTTFNSSGLKMRGNLRSKNAELIEKVRTSYEIQNKQTQP
ncbi:LPS export ABC transporter periplasmic protein LptC, partial [Salmonella enterica subsp. enterica serovar Cerro]|nr:LPS export ABC transporter periplasmic protein LptC [Salmonella enterica subsp. enterica serovar Cerro]